MQDLSDGIKDFNRYYSVSCSFLGDIEKGMGNPEKAREYYEKSLEVFMRIKEE